jgi:hypothetical protein
MAIEGKLGYLKTYHKQLKKYKAPTSYFKTMMNLCIMGK